jgi:hypothetical protein
MTITASEMIHAMNQGTLNPPLVLTGMVKPVDASNGTFMFSAGVLCLNWVEIDADSVEHVEVLYTARCGDHSHPFVRLTMKMPDKGDKRVVSLSRIATHLNAELIAARSQPSHDSDGPYPKVQSSLYRCSPCRNGIMVCTNGFNTYVVQCDPP